MLVEANRSNATYAIALNNASGAAELMSDFSYLEGTPHGTLALDFAHMAAPLTQEKREEYLPAGFGYQPTQQLLEVVSAVADYMQEPAASRHDVDALLPTRASRIGAFLIDMHLPQMLNGLGVTVQFTNPATAEIGRDDRTRQNLIPLTSIGVTLFGPDFKVIQGLHTQISRVFRNALPDEIDLADRFAGIVSEAVDNCIEYGHGGIICGLYYPRAGEVEISLVNSKGGFGGSTASEQLNALVAACERHTQRANGGGNGIAGLSHLSLMCFGTLVLRNGHATLRLPPDGSVVSTTEDTGLPTLGASVTLLLQLMPAAAVPRTATMRQFETVLKSALETYSSRKT